MNLTLEPKIVHWPETHYVYVEKIGPFQQNAPEAWRLAHTLAGALSEHNEITGYLSLYRMGPQIYRAGFAIAESPSKLPQGLEYFEFMGGKYSRFVLTGPYSQLGAATGRVMQLVDEMNIPVRDDFYIENYVNDPRQTPEAELITEILVPTE
jgi:effector-binding domain-containing protein